MAKIIIDTEESIARLEVSEEFAEKVKNYVWDEYIKSKNGTYKENLPKHNNDFMAQAVKKQTIKEHDANCPTCQALGYGKEPSPKPCPRCNGYGTIKHPEIDTELITCADCNGQGFIKS